MFVTWPGEEGEAGRRGDENQTEGWASSLPKKVKKGNEIIKIHRVYQILRGGTIQLSPKLTLRIWLCHLTQILVAGV